MFPRFNLPGKYKNCTRTLKEIKSKLCNVRDSKQVRQSVIWKYADTEFKNKVLLNKIDIRDIKKSISVLQQKILFQNKDVKDEAIQKRQNELAKNLPIGALAALGVFHTSASDAVTITGYGKHDLELLQELGLLTSKSSTPLTANIKTDALLSPGVDLPPSSLLESPINNTNIDANTIDAASLCDNHGFYHSIFDNMPPEEARNDIYTNLVKLFGTTETNELHQSQDVTDKLAFVTSDTNMDSVNNEAIVDNSINNNSLIEPIVEAIPEPPPIPDVAEVVSQVNALGESTFASLGLGGWTPIGIVQNCFEYLHVGLGVPWWEAIAIGTLIIRFLMFPLVIMAQRNAAKMNNHLPQMQVIQLKMTEARQSGNQMDTARYSQELMLFMKEKNLNPFKNMIVPLAQMPIFVSFFMGLRQMANVPVDSMRTGGLFWFTDLTVPDQFFALPVVTSLTLWATIELGTDSAKLSSQNMQTMKYVLRAMPFVILPFTVNFPGAILCYWVSSNFISLGQVGFLRIPAVRDFFKIDPLIAHNPANLPVKNKGFVGGIKDSWTNIKITKELEERRRLDELQFQRAGKGPLIKTFKYDPTKQTTKKTISAKNA